MKRYIFAVFAAFGTVAAVIPAQGAVRSNENRGWRFSLEADSTAIAPGFDDKGWQSVTLPHDWSILMPFDKGAPAGNDGGYLPTGHGWYRKTLKVNKTPGNRYKLLIGGAYMDSQVYVNGHLAGGHPYGYSSYFVDITPWVENGDNTLVISVDNSRQKNCRWYSGSGLYRDVTLIEQPPVHIADWGTRISTPDLTTANVEVTLENDTDSPRLVDVTVEIDGEKFVKQVTVPANGNTVASGSVSVPQTKPWTPETPNLYDVRISLSDNGKELETETLRTGFRTIAWDAENGFLLNGKPVLLNGGCAHHDNGFLGAAAYPDAERRRVRLMKEAGFNAVRTSHNAPSEHFLDACDEYGLMVIDEPFDGWRDAKNDYDYHKLFDRYWQQDVDALVKRDRNHPSIICWSIGNEVIERKKIEVVTTAHKLANRCRQLDGTRPVTSALCAWDNDWEIYDPLAAEHDIVGYNYMIHKSESDHERVPERVMMQTESYPNDAWSNYRKVADNQYIIGDFVWTAIDYIGESGIGRHYYEGDVPGEHYHRPLWPWHAAHCGDIDLTGYRKPISHYRSMLWNEDGEHLYIAVKEPDGYKGKVQTTLWGTWPTYQSWNWPGHEGKPIDVEVYSHYPRVRLSLDGKTVGESAVDEMKARFTLPYAAGTLKAEGLDADGNVKETKTLATAGAPARIRLKTDNIKPTADDGLAFVEIEIVDKQGNVVPVAENQLHVEVSGPARLAALGNADIKDTDPYFDADHRAWNGRALAVVRADGKPGKVKLKVSSPGLPTKTLNVF